MIQFICPTCDKRLAVADAKAGKIAVCPACQTRIIVPEVEPSPEAVTAEPPQRRRLAEDDEAPAPSSRRRRPDDDDDDRPRRRRAEDDDDDEDIPDAELDRPRRRKKKRRRKRSVFKVTWLPFALTPYLVTMTCLIVFATPLMLLSTVVPQFGYICFGMGVIMWLCGRIWFLSVAFSDDSVQGMLCLWCWPYPLVYLCINFEDAKRPFFLVVTGDFLTAWGMVTSRMME